MAKLTESQLLGRSKNAISSFLDKKLAVPKIYLDANWNATKIDVLAIDRAGVGDVHAVLLVTRKWESAPIPDAAYLAIAGDTVKPIELILSLPCQYKYVAFVANFPIAHLQASALLTEAMNNTFAESGIGRIGVFFINTSETDLRVQELVKAERFRSTKEILDLTDRYVQTHTADMEYRDPVYEQEATV